MESTYYFLIVVTSLAICFIAGVILLAYNITQKHQKGIKIGILITSIPFLIIGTFFLYFFIDSKYTTPYPNEKELVGVYHLVGASSDVEETDLKNCRLVFKSDGKFKLTSIPYVNNCGEGDYYIDKEFGYGYTLSMGCGFESYIDTNWDSFQVKLIFGDNDLEYEERSFLVFEKYP
jgi:hypothetical protein